MTLQFRRTVAAGVEACLHVRERTRKNPVLREVHVPHHFTMRWAQFHDRGRFEHTAASCRGRRATATEREALRGWIEQLLVLRASDLSRRAKAKRALALTAESKVVWPTVKAVSREVKRHAWDDRSRAARMGLGGAAVAGAVFGGQSAGLAALGTAIAVPLWVVFGAGATFFGVLYEEITGQKPEIRSSDGT